VVATARRREIRGGATSFIVVTISSRKRSSEILMVLGVLLTVA
jgi:hypothetical protein